MNILLINPPYTTRDGLLKKRHPPLGLCYIASTLLENGHSVEILDMENHSEDLTHYNPDAVGISANMTAFYPDAVRVGNKVKDTFDVPVIVGGHHPTAVPRETLSQPCFDVVIRGESEIVFPLVTQNISNFDGVVNGGRIKDIDGIPWPARDLLEKDYDVATMISSRGCPYNCIFCVSPHSLFVVRNPTDVVDEMEDFVARGNNQIVFMDDMFGLRADWLERFCAELKKRNLDVSWRCISRGDIMNEKKARMMAETGCDEIRLGVETGSPRIMKLINKGETLPQIEDAVRAIHSAGIRPHTYFMLGHPTETRVEMGQTVEFAKHLSHEYGATNSFAITEINPGSKLQEMLGLRHDWLSPINPDYRYPNVPTWPNFSGAFSLDEVKRIRDMTIIETRLQMRGRFGYLLRKLWHPKSVLSHSLKYLKNRVGAGD